MAITPEGFNDGDESNQDFFPHFTVERQALTIAARHRNIAYEAPPRIPADVRLKQTLKESVSCSKKKLKNLMYTRLPIFTWLLNYDIKNWLVSDIVAGITMAICHIPIGMGYTLLAEVPAIHGIYTAFYPVLMYTIFATSRHNSMGSFAVITLMTGGVVRELATFPPDATHGAVLNTTADTTDQGLEFTTESDMLTTRMSDSDTVTYTPIQIATLVTFMIGVWQTLFGFLKLGSLSMFLSDMLISGFTTGAAVHIILSQVKDLLGLDIHPPNLFKMYFLTLDVIREFNNINVAAVVISAITLTVLVFNYLVIAPQVAKITKLPVPIELIVMVIGTAVVSLAGLQKPYDVIVLGHIPTGLPPPTVPPLELFRKVASSSLIIAVCSYIISYSIAKIFAGKSGNYKVKATQEMFAQGYSNLFASFFSCVPMTAALSRTIIQYQGGGKTQLTSLISCFLLIFVLLFLGPLLESLPKAILASIITFAMKTMLMQVFEMTAMWKISKMESITWCVCFFSVIIINIEIGLFIGIVFSLFVLLSRNQTPLHFRLGRVPKTDLYLDINTYPEAKEVPEICIFRLTGAIHYANTDQVKKFILTGTGIDPKEIYLNKLEAAEHPMEMRNNGTAYNVEQPAGDMIKYLLLDLSGLSYVDASGGMFLEHIRHQYEKADIEMCISGLSESVLDKMQRCRCLSKFPPSHLFHSVHDAIVILTDKSIGFKEHL